MNAPENVGYGGSGGFLGETLNELRDWFKTYIHFQKESDAEILALWVFHTWLIPDYLYTSPRLNVKSSTPGSGKTTTFEHAAKLSRNGELISSVTSPAAIKAMAKGGWTMFIDEADRNLIRTRPGYADIISIINTGYKFGATAPTNTPRKGGSWELEKFPTFAPIAMAGNGTQLPNDTLERCINIHLLKDVRSQVQETDWEKLDAPINALADALANSANENKDWIKSQEPELPEGCVNRHRERWKPLAKIAAAAGEPWASRIFEIIQQDIEVVNAQIASGDAFTAPHILLMQDLQVIYGDQAQFIPSMSLIQKLRTMNPVQWGVENPFGKELTQQKMGRLLTDGWSIYSERHRESDSRGYHSSQFYRAWENLGLLSNKPTEPTEPTGQVQESNIDELF